MVNLVPESTVVNLVLKPSMANLVPESSMVDLVPESIIANWYQSQVVKAQTFFRTINYTKSQSYAQIKNTTNLFLRVIVMYSVYWCDCLDQSINHLSNTDTFHAVKYIYIMLNQKADHSANIAFMIRPHVFFENTKCGKNKCNWFSIKYER